MNAESPIGVFDSGVGGISVLAELERELPHEHFVYYGDTLHAPYGTKTPEEVMACVRQVMNELMARNVKAVVIACNTATSVAAATLRQEMTLPIIGMEPALKPASQIRQEGAILVLATPVTLSLPKFQSLMERYGEGAIPLPCPGLMELVEQKNFPEAKRYLQQVLSAYDLAQVDAVVLGCTHYVFLRPLLKELLPSHVQIMDGNSGTAKQLRRVLEKQALLRNSGEGNVVLLTSSPKEEDHTRMAELLVLARQQSVVSGM